MNFEEFKTALIKRSEQITTCFFINESTEEEFEHYFECFNDGMTIDEIIWTVFKISYGEK